MVDDRFPKDWKKKKLSDVGFSYSGLKSKSKKDFDEDGNAQFVTYRNINRNYFVDKHDLASVQVEEDENQNHVLKGDVLFTGSSETPEEVAFSSVMKEEIKNLYLNSFSFGYRFNNPKEFLPEFYGYYFRGPNFRKNVFPLAQGSTRYNLSKNEVLKIDIPVPSFKEQQKIASILSSVDEAIEKTKSIIEHAQIVKKGLMKELLTKGIRHVEFINSPIGKIPRKWKLKEFKEVMVLQRGYDLPTKDRNRGSYPLLSANGVTDYIDQYKVKGPGVVTGRSGTIGKVHFIENSYWPLNTSLYVKEMYDNNPKFLYYLLLSLKLERFSTGTGVPTLNRNIVHKEKVQVPPLSEQNQISKILDSIGNKVEKEFQKLSNLFVLKQGLMQQLLTGKVRVPTTEDEEVPQ